jgi:hypothetical protein
MPIQSKKPFLIIQSMLYSCNEETPKHQMMIFPFFSVAISEGLNLSEKEK